jgi:glutamate-ammonia-ligase adenylyltransferase
MQVDTRRLSDIGTCTLRPMSQTDAKSVLSSLKDMAKTQPAIADLLASETPLKDFVVAALSLSPYLRDTAVSHPPVLVQAIGRPLIPYLEACVQTARDAWKGADAGKPLTDAEIMTRLRQAKRDIAFAIALADLLPSFRCA